MIECVGYLRKIVYGICERIEEIVRVILLEMGKILLFVWVEVNFIVDYIDYMVEWVRCYEGEIF